MKFEALTCVDGPMDGKVVSIPEGCTAYHIPSWDEKWGPLVTYKVAGIYLVFTSQKYVKVSIKVTA